MTCFFGFHDWHEHTVYCEGQVVKRNGKLRVKKDLVCLRCGKEDRRASGAEARARERNRRIQEAEEKLREASDA